MDDCQCQVTTTITQSLMSLIIHREQLHYCATCTGVGNQSLLLLYHVFGTA